MMEPYFFETPLDFRKWLDENHEQETELLVGFYKTGSKKPSITWSQSVDEALCYGWIDGVRKSRSEDSYTIRFTPRKATSIWSAINIDKMEALLKNDLVKPMGIAAYEKRKESRSKVYSHEQKEPIELSEAFEAEFKANVSAWLFFMDQAPSYRKVMIHYINSAKQEKTKRSRFDVLLKASELKKRVQ